MIRKLEWADIEAAAKKGYGGGRAPTIKKLAEFINAHMPQFRADLMPWSETPYRKYKGSRIRHDFKRREGYQLKVWKKIETFPQRVCSASSYAHDHGNLPPQFRCVPVDGREQETMIPLKFYAGIGSRSTPPWALILMTSLAADLSQAGYILRSGGAHGADSAFEMGAAANAEVYMPWRWFNGKKGGIVVPETSEAVALAKSIHPTWSRLSPGARKLHIRNCYQVLGADLKTPSSFILCWTPEGSGSGGTGQAIRLAKQRGIPVYDIGSHSFSVEEFRCFVAILAGL